jgi:hypothetical protein
MRILTKNSWLFNAGMWALLQFRPPDKLFNPHNARFLESWAASPYSLFHFNLILGKKIIE